MSVFKPKINNSVQDLQLIDVQNGSYIVTSEEGDLFVDLNNQRYHINSLEADQQLLNITKQNLAALGMFIIDQKTILNYENKQLILDQDCAQVSSNILTVKNTASTIKKLTSLISTGSQFISIPFHCTNNTRIECKIQFSNSNESMCAFGTKTTQKQISIKHVANEASLQGASTGVSYIGTFSTNSQYNLILQNGSIQNNNVRYLAGSLSSFSLNSPFILFGLWNSSLGQVQQLFKGKIFYFKIYENNILQYDFIPILDSLRKPMLI